MAFNFTRASTQGLYTASTPVSLNPITIAAWFNRRNTTGFQYIVAMDRYTTSPSGLCAITCSSAAATVQATSTTDGTTFINATTTTTHTLNTWNHACGVFANNSSRTIYLNGGNNVTNSTLANVTGLNNITIGSRFASGIFSAASCLDGIIAEVGIWNAALTQPEIASLAKGITCDKIRPQNLVFYAPLIRDLQDTKGGLGITNNNGATVADHPRIYS
jgi:hypothetical protein